MHLIRATLSTEATLATMLTLPAVATLPATATLPAEATLPATAALPAVATLPATATLPALATLPATAALLLVATLPVTAAPAPMSPLWSPPPGTGLTVSSAAIGPACPQRSCMASPKPWYRSRRPLEHPGGAEGCTDGYQVLCSVGERRSGVLGNTGCVRPRATLPSSDEPVGLGAHVRWG